MEFILFIVSTLSIIPFLLLPMYTLVRFFNAEYISFFRAIRLGVYTGLLSCLFGVSGALLVHLGSCGIEHFGSTGACDPSGASGWFAFPYIILAIPAGVIVSTTKIVKEIIRKNSNV